MVLGHLVRAIGILVVCLTRVKRRTRFRASLGSQPGAGNKSGLKAESVPKGFGADPSNLIQVMLAKGWRSLLSAAENQGSGLKAIYDRKPKLLRATKRRTVAAIQQ